MDRQTGRHTDIQTDRQTDIQMPCDQSISRENVMFPKRTFPKGSVKQKQKARIKTEDDFIQAAQRAIANHKPNAL